MSAAFEPMNKSILNNKEQQGKDSISENKEKVESISMKNKKLETKVIINSKNNNIYIIDFMTIKRKKYSMFPSEVKKKCIEAVIYNIIKRRK